MHSIGDLSCDAGFCKWSRIKSFLRILSNRNNTISEKFIKVLVIDNLLLIDILTCEANRKEYRYKTDDPNRDCRKIEPKIFCVGDSITYNGLCCEIRITVSLLDPSLHSRLLLPLISNDKVA